MDEYKIKKILQTKGKLDEDMKGVLDRMYLDDDKLFEIPSYNYPQSYEESSGIYLFWSNGKWGLFIKNIGNIFFIDTKPAKEFFRLGYEKVLYDFKNKLIDEYIKD